MTSTSCTDTRTEEVTALIRYRRRCHRIVLCSGSSESALRVNICDVFGDVLGAEQCFFIQLKDNDWGGEFVDVLKVTDKCVQERYVILSLCSFQLHEM